jgi:hypothetical protein
VLLFVYMNHIKSIFQSIPEVTIKLLNNHKEIHEPVNSSLNAGSFIILSPSQGK